MKDNVIHPDLTDPSGPGPKKAAPTDTVRLKRDIAKDDAAYAAARSAAVQGYGPADADARAAFKRAQARSDSLTQLRKGKKP